MVKKLSSGGKELHFMYETDPCGYETFCFLKNKEFDCVVCSPAYIPKNPANRIKTDSCDAKMFWTFLAACRSINELAARNVRYDFVPVFDN